MMSEHIMQTLLKHIQLKQLISNKICDNNIKQRQGVNRAAGITSDDDRLKKTQKYIV